MTVENGQLMAQATGQLNVPLFAASEARFFLKVVPAEVEFFRDPATHKVDRMILYQGGHAIEGRKQEPRLGW